MEGWDACWRLYHEAMTRLRAPNASVDAAQTGLPVERVLAFAPRVPHSRRRIILVHAGRRAHALHAYM